MSDIDSTLPGVRVFRPGQPCSFSAACPRSNYTALYLRSTAVKIRLAATNTRSDDPERRAEALCRIATEADLGFAASPTDTGT